MRRLRDNRGETLVEVMAAVLVGALSVALLFTCISVSYTMEKRVQKQDEAHYNALSDADAQNKATVPPQADPDSPGTPVTPKVTITGYSGNKAYPEIAVYGDTTAGLYSYKRAGS